MTENEIYKKLRDKDSPYFAGSACLLSLLPVIKAMEKEIPYQQEEYKILSSNIHKLMEDDGVYFALSLKQEPLTADEWKKAIDITWEYESVLLALNEIMYLLNEIHSPLYLSLIKEKFLILAKLCQLCLASFYDMDNQPEEFFQAGNMALLAIRGEEHEEL